jgi:hypothetical protein
MSFVSGLRFPWVIGAKDKHVGFADAQEHGRIIVRQMTGAATYRRSIYGIRYVGCAPVCIRRVDSRDPLVDSVLTAGHPGTAAAVRGSAWEERAGLVAVSGADQYRVRPFALAGA